MLEWMKLIWDSGIPCVFHSVTGAYCPGCGGTRAVKALLAGDLAASFRFHPIIVYTVFIIVLEFVTWLLARLLKKPELHVKHYNFFVYLGIGVIMINWIFKDVMLLVYRVDLLA